MFFGYGALNERRRLRSSSSSQDGDGRRDLERFSDAAGGADARGSVAGETLTTEPLSKRVKREAASGIIAEDDDCEDEQAVCGLLERNKAQERRSRSDGAISMKEKLLCVGLACVDVVDILDRFPEEDSEVRSKKRMRRLGGNGANFIRVACQFDRLNCTLMYNSTSDEADSNAAFVREELTKAGINDLSVWTGDGRGQIPASFIIQSESTGSRTIVHHSSLPELTFNDFESVYIPCSFSWVHFEGRSVKQLTEMMKFVESSCTVSLEIEKDRKPDDVLSLVQYADVIMIGKEFATRRGFQTAEEFLTFLWDSREKLRIKMSTKIVLAWGADGAYGVCLTDESSSAAKPEVLHAKAMKLGSSIVDSVGAGDTFNAGLIVGLLRGLTIFDAMTFACTVAGTKLQRQGLEDLAISMK